MRPLAEAKALAAELIELLGDKCQRIEVAGSIRRLAPEVKDVELVAIPKTSPAQNDLFGEVSAERNHLLDELNLLVRLGLLSKRISDDGKACWGPRHQRALYKDVPVDVFQVLPPAQWGVIFAIRTGPAEFSRRLHAAGDDRRAGRPLAGRRRRRVHAGSDSGGGRLLPTPEDRR